MKTPIFKTKKFTLRPYKLSDAKAIAKNINNLKIINNIHTLPYPYKLKDARNFIKKTILKYKDKTPESIAWTFEIDGEACGGFGFHQIRRGHKAEIGYWLAEKHWGNGIMSDAVKIACKFGFNKLKLRRIFGRVYDFNHGSRKVLENNGFKIEGLMKKEAKKKNKYIDVYLLAKVR